MAYRMTKEELDQQFEQFLRESVSDDSIELGGKSMRPSVLDQLGKVPQKQVKKSHVAVPWWQDDEDSEEALGKGAMEPAKTFRKSLRRSQPIQEVDEEQLKERSFEHKSKGDTLIFSRDSLEPEDSVLTFGSAHNAAGLSLNDDDEEEKARFFTCLDKGMESQGDDPKLDKKQESSGSTFNSQQRGGALSLTKQDPSEDGERVSVKNNSAASPAYSEDFEDETSPKEFEEKKPEKCGMLAKVSLHDSLNSKDGAQVHALANNAAERTEWLHPRMARQQEKVSHYGQSGASEMEALQEAYRQISHSVESVRRKFKSQAGVQPLLPLLSAPEEPSSTFPRQSQIYPPQRS
ncbi:hypothetical protein MHYP_G00027680 [Metynnis hypsauchen]